MYPPLSKLSPGAEAIGTPLGTSLGTSLDTLTDDALEAILSSDSFDGDDTCAAVLGVCSVNHPLRKQCSEAFFEAASGRMGFGRPEGGGEGQPPAPSWREFFARSCRWLQMARDARLMDSNNFFLRTLGFSSVGKWAILRVHPMLLKYVPARRADYADLARIALHENGLALGGLSPTCADYVELALIAVSNNGWALQDVNSDSPGYGELAKVAVSMNGEVLNAVNTERTDYGAIAMIAVQHHGWAIQYVPTDRRDYGELARVAVQRQLWSLKYVPRDHPDYDEIAKLAQ